MDPRRRRVIWAPEALADLDAAIGFIAGMSQQGAANVLERALEIAESLSTLSERGRRVPELENEGYREVFVSGYRLMYLVVGHDVRIVAFVHGARQFSDLDTGD